MNKCTNQNSLLLTLNKWTSISSKSRNTYRYSNQNAVNYFRNHGGYEDTQSGAEKLTSITKMFNYELSHNSSNNKKIIAHVEYHNNSDIIPEIEIDFKALRNYLKDKIQIFIMTKETDPSFWNSINFEPRRAHYRNREVTQEDLDKIKYLIILRDMSHYHIDFESNYLSHFPKELFEWYETKYQQVKDMTVFFENMPSLLCSFENRVSPFTEGRRYSEVLNYTSSSKGVSDIHFIEDVARAKECLGNENMGMFKYKSLLKGASPPIPAFKNYSPESFHTGYGLFPYKTSNVVTVYTGSEFKQLSFYGFATFIKSATVRRYVKAKVFLNDFFNKISNFEGCYLYNLEKYELLLREIYKGHIQYSNYLEKVFPNETNCTKSLIINEKASKETLPSVNLSGLLSLGRNKNYKTLKQISDSIKEIDEKKKMTERKVAEHDQISNRSAREIQDQKTRIEQYQAYINQAQKRIQTQEEYLKSADEALEKNKKEVENYTEVLSQLKPQKDTIYKAYKKEIEVVEPSDNEDKFTSNINRKGVYIEKITYKDKDGELVDSKAEPSVVLRAKRNSMLGENEYALHEIRFKIVKPIVVRVDPLEKGEDCHKIAVGPLYVTLLSNTILLSPLTTSCVFGYESGSGNIWLHPHTSAKRMSYNNMDDFLSSFIKMEQTGCLGEASTAIYNAFKAQDPRQAILAAMTWITSANSSDAWGKNWKHFPKLSEISSIEKKINLEEEEKRKISNSLTDAESILTNIFSANSDITSIQYESATIENFIISEANRKLVKVLEESSNETLIESESSQESIEPEPEQTNLRRVGIEGYQPLFT